MRERRRQFPLWLWLSAHSRVSRVWLDGLSAACLEYLENMVTAHSYISLRSYCLTRAITCKVIARLIFAQSRRKLPTKADSPQQAAGSRGTYCWWWFFGAGRGGGWKIFYKLDNFHGNISNSALSDLRINHTCKSLQNFRSILTTKPFLRRPHEAFHIQLIKMEPWPATPLRILRLADRLNGIAVELIEPILTELSLNRVLQLACTPAATPATSRLRWAIENSPAWRPVFMDKFEHFRSLWQSLVHFARLWRREDIYHLPFLHEYNLCRTASELVSKHGSTDITRELEEIFQSRFQTVMGIIPGWPSGLRRDCYSPICSPAIGDAICAFIPIEVVSLVDGRDFKKLSQILEGHDNTSTQHDQWAAQVTEALQFIPSAGASPLLTHNSRVNHIRKWDTNQLQAFLPHFIRAYECLNAVKSDQLFRLATMYEAYPAWLKKPLAPQSPAPRPNTLHISSALRKDAELIRSSRMSSWAGFGKRYWYRFQKSHPALVPTDKALQIFAAYGENNFSYPKDLQSDVECAREGFWRIYKHDGTLGENVRCLCEGSLNVPEHVHYRERCHRAYPSPEAELQWLSSLMRCVQWITEQALSSSWSLPRPLLEPEDYHRYIASEPVEVIAKQLLADRQISGLTKTCSSELPSLTALYMPPYSSQRTREVAECVWPDMDVVARQLLWEEMIKKIKLGLTEPPPLPSHEDDQVLACDTSTQLTHDIQADSWESSVQQYQTSRTEATSGTWTQVKCYICRMRITKPHKTLKAMCHPCGEFNLAGSGLSLPQNLNLKGKTALITGGRTNLGFHVALRLLRCGARVIVSTRYPRDAAARYRAQPDVDEWVDRLRVVGADFRSARDAFELVARAKAVVEEWGGTLNILINNAAQTITDSLDVEKTAVRRETLLSHEKEPMLVEGSSAYKPRIRGGMTANTALEVLVPEQSPTETSPARIDDTDEGKKVSSLAAQISQLEISRASPSSWVQSMSEIPYEDIISAHSVNTFVPLILVRELLPMMNHKTASQPETSSSPLPSQQSSAAGYIVNVSSREGIFESRADHQAKAGKHVHTNMSKAGLNMITETEASSAWNDYRVAMNTVDPGYMSAAPELEHSYGGERPLGWEDGAGRVLWPVAMGEGRRDGVLRGRFLKHYGAVRVDTRLGRG